MDEHVMTYEGIGQAVAILARERLIDVRVEPKDVAEGLAILDVKATTFLAESRAKGDARTQQEHDEAYLIACFKLWIEGKVQLVETAEA